MHIKWFHNFNFDAIYVIGIPEDCMNIMSCHAFLQEEDAMVTFRLSRKLVSYYLLEVFVTLDNE